VLQQNSGNRFPPMRGEHPSDAHDTKRQPCCHDEPMIEPELIDFSAVRRHSPS
jgi:hypothetical protein